MNTCVMGMCTNESVCRNVFVYVMHGFLWSIFWYLHLLQSVYSLNGRWLCCSGRDRECDCSARATLGTIVTCRGLEHRTRTQRQLEYFQHGDITTTAALKESHTDNKGSSPLPQWRQNSPVACHRVTHNADRQCIETVSDLKLWTCSLTTQIILPLMSQFC